jgi:hypothetical protein
LLIIIFIDYRTPSSINTDVSTEIIIQAMLSNDGRPAEAVGFKPSSDSSGSEASQAMLPDDGRPAEAVGFKPSSIAVARWLAR